MALKYVGFDFFPIAMLQILPAKADNVQKYKKPWEQAF